jgi:hypothetical protein
VNREWWIVERLFFEVPLSFRLLAAAQVSVQKQDANLGHKHKQRTG